MGQSQNAHNVAPNAAAQTATARSGRGQGPHGHRAQRVRRPLPLRFSKTGRPSSRRSKQASAATASARKKRRRAKRVQARCARTRHCGAVAYGDEECTLYRTGALNGSTSNACVASYRTNERPATGRGAASLRAGPGLPLLLRRRPQREGVPLRSGDGLWPETRRPTSGCCCGLRTSGSN